MWRWRERSDPEGAERLERRALGLIAVAMVVVAAYIGFEAIRALVHGSHVDEPTLGIALAVLAAGPALARAHEAPGRRGPSEPSASR